MLLSGVAVAGRQRRLTASGACDSGDQPVGQTRQGLPRRLLGVWEIAGEPYRYEFTATGEFFLYDRWWPWDVSPDSQTLTYGVETWSRTFSSGQVLEGVWYNAALSADWYLRADLTYTFHWQDGTGEEYFGRYEVSGSDSGRSSIAPR